MTELSNDMVQELTKLAQAECWGDELDDSNADVIVDDFAGGNIDDAFAGGYYTGMTELARRILSESGVEY